MYFRDSWASNNDLFEGITARIEVEQHILSGYENGSVIHNLMCLSS